MVLKLTSPTCFYFSNVATRKLKIIPVAHILFVLDSAVLINTHFSPLPFGILPLKSLRLRPALVS